MSDQERLAKLERLLRKAGIDVDADEHRQGLANRPPRETPAAAAARLGLSEPDCRAIAQSLEVPPAELGSVTQGPDGLLVDTGGMTVLLRPPEKPDGAGNVGWVRLPHPDPDVEMSRAMHHCPFPVFVPEAPVGGQAA